jgi:hypothetical protein
MLSHPGAKQWGEDMHALAVWLGFSVFLAFSNYNSS